MDGESSQASKSSVFYSSFQPDLVAQGLMKQSGWGHSWRTFGGKLGCRNQTAQCARTPLLPYAWWDSPWQSPSSRDIRKLQMVGIKIDEVGQVSEHSLDDFCAAQEKPIVLQMRVPTCTKLKPCTSLISWKTPISLAIWPLSFVSDLLNKIHAMVAGDWNFFWQSTSSPKVQTTAQLCTYILP